MRSSRNKDKDSKKAASSSDGGLFVADFGKEGIALCEKTMTKLGFKRGGYHFLHSTPEGKPKRTTVAILRSPDDTVDTDAIRVHPSIRDSLRVRVGDKITVEECKDIATGKSVAFEAYEDPKKKKLKDSEHLENFIKPNYFEALLPVHVGDIIEMLGPNHTNEYKVISCDPSPYCLVDEGTELVIGSAKGKPTEVNQDILAEIEGGVAPDTNPTSPSTADSKRK